MIGMSLSTTFCLLNDLYSRQDSTKCTPFLLMYGREARLPIQLTQATSELDEDDFEAKVKHMAELRAKVHSNTLANIAKSPGASKETL